MTKIFEQILNKKISIITESSAVDIKSISSGSYNRQHAEDMLYKTIGPLTDNPRWSNRPWQDARTQTEMPEDYVPNGPAPKWSPEEVIFAFAGNPSKLFKSGGDSPKGSPLYRSAMQVARKFKKDTDRSFIEDLYQNGMVPLVKMMKPGFDEGREPFISYVIRSVQGAIENGPGGSLEAQAATSDDRATKQVGLRAAMKITDPNAIRQAANVVQGKYQTEASYDRAPGNPYGHYSSDFFNVMNNYADALEGGNPERINDARTMIQQLVTKIDDVNTEVRGASSGLGQAISNKDRGAVSGDAIHLRTARGIVAKAIKGTPPGQPEIAKMVEAITTTRKNRAALEKQSPDEMEYADKKRLSYIKRYDEVLGETAKALNTNDQMALKEVYQRLTEEMKENQENNKFGVSSMDAQSGDGGDLKSTLPGSDGGGNDARELMMNQDVVNYALNIGIKYDLNKVLTKNSKYRTIAQEKAKGGDLGGKFTVNEFRYLIRSLGQTGADYPGKGKMRSNVAKPRDAVGWWQPGEDPEIEPIPGGEGQWNSIWTRGGYQSMGPTEISNEITSEVEEFNKLGIKTARQVKVDEKGEKSVAGKVAIFNTLKAAKVKLETIMEIHRSEFGLDESVEDRLPPDLFTDAIDRQLVVETVETMICKLDKVLLEFAIVPNQQDKML